MKVEEEGDQYGAPAAVGQSRSEDLRYAVELNFNEHWRSDIPLEQLLRLPTSSWQDRFLELASKLPRAVVLGDSAYVISRILEFLDASHRFRHRAATRNLIHKWLIWTLDHLSLHPDVFPSHSPPRTPLQTALLRGHFKGPPWDMAELVSSLECAIERGAA